MRSAQARALPFARCSGHLALVGGGPSVANHLDELRAWGGEVWAINGAWAWLRGHGIDATFCSLHPLVDVPQGVNRAVLGDECAPEFFDALKGAEVLLLPDQMPTGGRFNRGPTTATGVAIASVAVGFSEVSFFGLEGSYAERTHNYDVYQDPTEFWVIVKANGETFRTKGEFLLQSQELSNLVHALPHRFHDRSGGLLAALVQDFDYDVLDASPALLAVIEESYGHQSLYYGQESAAQYD